MLDEPTAGVDVELRHSLWTFMRKLNGEGHTIVLTTHYLEEAQENCERIAMLKKGELVALERTDTLLHNDKGLRIELLLTAELPQALLPKAVSQIGLGYVLTLDNYNEVADILIFLKTAGIGVQQMEILETDLEQVFINLTGAGA